MIQVVGVRFKKAGKVYYFDPGDLSVSAGSKVVVETARGIEYGDVAIGPKEVSDDQVVQPLKKVVRVGTDRDAQVAAENKRKEKEAFAVAQKKIEAHGLDMNLVDVEYTFDGSKNIFYFTSEGRVDFRELVRDLASVFRTRIEMRQIGVRDEAKLLGGIGPCGRILCCTSFLGDFAPVSIRMAKDQNLSLNPSKISGLCGRLMCCLRYEQETYEAAKKDPTLAPGYMPPVQVTTEPEVRLLDEDDDNRRPRAGLLSPPEGYGARIAQALAPPTRNDSAGQQSRDKDRRSDRPPQRGESGPRPQGKSQQMSGPRSDRDNRPQGERSSNQGRRQPQQPMSGPQAQKGGAGPQSKQQGQIGPMQPRKAGQPAPRTPNEAQAHPRPAGEAPQGERRHRRRHRGKRPGADRPQEGSPPKA